MTGRAARALVAAVLTCAACAAACERGAEPRGGPAAGVTDARTARSTLAPAAMPNLSRVEPALRERLQAGQSSLLLAEKRTATSDEGLALAYGDVGMLLLAGEFPDAARPYFENAHALASADHRWPYYLGHVHRLMHDPATAVLLLERARQRQPDDAATLVWLGRLYVEQGRVADGVPLLERASALGPASVSARLSLGRAALGERRYRDAVTHLETALAAEPAALVVHYPLALAYRGLGQEEKAQAHLRLWKNVDPVIPDPLMDAVGRLLRTSLDFAVRGTRALDERRWVDAAGEFSKGLELAPRDPVLHLNLGTARYLAGDEPGALAEFQEAVRLSPGYARAHFALGVLREARGEDEVAIARFTEALEHDGGLTDARFTLADALRRVGRPDASLTHYQELVRADPSASQARFGYAMALVRLHRYREAVAALEEATKAHPDQPGFAHALARLLAAAPEEGIRDGRRALAMVQRLRAQFSSPALTETVAMAQAEVGQFAQAVATQRASMADAGRLGQAAPQLAENLALYERELPCRAPWRDDDPVHLPRATAGLGR